MKYNIGDKFAVCDYDDLYEIVEVVGYVDNVDESEPAEWRTEYLVEYRTGSSVGVCWEAMRRVLEPVAKYDEQQAYFATLGQ